MGLPKPSNTVLFVLKLESPSRTRLHYIITTSTLSRARLPNLPRLMQGLLAGADFSDIEKFCCSSED